MQLLAESSTEGGLTEGLNLIPGKVMPLDGAGHERVPHIGWNSLNITKNSPLLEGITEGDDFYFVHGYHLTAPEEVIVARTPYCGSTVAVVQKAHVYATQFHPEKSQKVGFTILRNFLSHTC
jgi:glutamine amidotransferase